MASHGDQKKDKPRLFGVDLTLHEHPATSNLAGETRANKQGRQEVPELAASASKSTSTAQCPKARVCSCCYYSKKFYNSKALGGHQNAHKNERTASKSNPILKSPSTNSFQYPPVVGQQQTFNPRHSHKFELQRVDLSNYRPHFEQSPPNLPGEFSSSSLSTVKGARNDIEFVSSSVSSLKMPRNGLELPSSSFHSVKRARHEDYRPNLRGEFWSSPLSSVKMARNDIELVSSSLSSVQRSRNGLELASSSLPSVKRARNEDPRQRNTTDNTEHAELDLSLHL